MPNLCGEPNPDEPSLRCVMPQGNHSHHTAVRPGIPPRGVDWVNEDFVEAARTRSASQRQVLKRDLTARVKEAQGGPPAGAVEAWEAQRPEWIERAKTQLRHLCQHRVELTTMDLWPLLDSPGDGRVMSIVVQYATRRRWMVETGRTIRMAQGAVTRDGIPVPENKHVPVYRSLLHFEEDEGPANS